MEMKDQWNFDILWSKIELQWQIAEGKKSQLLYEEQFQILKEIETQLHEAVKKLKTKN